MTNQQRDLLGLQVFWLLDVPQPALAPPSTFPPSCLSLSSSWVVICLFLRIVEDTVCLVLALMVDMNKIKLCCFLEELTGVLLVDLSRVVDSWLWCLLRDIAEVLLAEFYGISHLLPFDVPTLLLWIFGLYFSTTSTSLRSSSSLSAGGEAKNSSSPSSAFLSSL